MEKEDTRKRLLLGTHAGLNDQSKCKSKMVLLPAASLICIWCWAFLRFLEPPPSFYLELNFNWSPVSEKLCSFWRYGQWGEEVRRWTVPHMQWLCGKLVCIFRSWQRVWMWNHHKSCNFNSPPSLGSCPLSGLLSGLNSGNKIPNSTGDDLNTFSCPIKVKGKTVCGSHILSVNEVGLGEWQS